MDILPGTPFSPGTVVGISGIIPLGAQNGSFIIIMNESQANLLFTFPNGKIAYVPSYDRRKICFSGQMVQPIGPMIWTVQSVPLLLSLLANQVAIEIYQAGEHSPEVYPASLFRQLRAFS